MSQAGDGGSNALKAPAFIIGIAVLIVSVLYVTKRCGPNLFVQETFPRNHFRGSSDPPETSSDTGEKPRTYDVWIVPWCSSQPGSQLERLEPAEGQGEDEKRSGWAEFIVSCPAFSLNQPLSVPSRFVSSRSYAYTRYPATIRRQGIRRRYCSFLTPSEER